MSQPWLDPGAWAKLIDSLIWPGVVVGIIYVYRRQASALLSRVKHFQITGVLDANFTAVSSEVSKTGDLAAQGAPEEVTYSSWDAFLRVYPWLDKAKLNEAAAEYARKNNIPDAFNMGPENFRKFLYQSWLPGGVGRGIRGPMLRPEEPGLP